MMAKAASARFPVALTALLCAVVLWAVPAPVVADGPARPQTRETTAAPGQVAETATAPDADHSFVLSEQEGREPVEGEDAAYDQDATGGSVAEPRPRGVGSAARKSTKPRSRVRNRGPVGAPECDFRTPLWEHVVVSGEQLGVIAGRYGVRQADVLALNPQITDPNLIRIGDHIRICPEIPPRERIRVSYTVRSGDNVQKIAEQYGLSVRDIVVFQRGRLADPNRIRAGQELVIWLEGEILPAFRPQEEEPARLHTAVQLPPGRHYHIKRPHLAYGTPKTVRSIQRALEGYSVVGDGGPKVYVGDLSKRGGGPIPPHLSHQSGHDVDVGYIRRGADADNPRFTGVTRITLDAGRTWSLVKSFLDTGEVKYIFMDYAVQKLLYDYARSRGVAEDELDGLFQYPRGRGRSHGIIRHWRGHRNHFHVRFR